MGLTLIILYSQNDLYTYKKLHVKIYKLINIKLECKLSLLIFTYPVHITSYILLYLIDFTVTTISCMINKKHYEYTSQSRGTTNYKIKSKGVHHKEEEPKASRSKLTVHQGQGTGISKPKSISCTSETSATVFCYNLGVKIEFAWDDLCSCPIAAGDGCISSTWR